MTVDTSTERLRGLADELLHGADQSALMAWEGLTERQRRAAEILLAIAEERDRLVAERNEAWAEGAILREALTKAAGWFQGYADGHTAKGDIDKAKRNQDRADACRAAAGDAP